ncbi:putative Metal-dependent phosphohydrolase, HD protein [Candidatus Zixiibacteriota bacterium]|nr:putative Metal-dependent phosphohydrolase, HD protein [candidate division Zixibacteria bacterium]
MPDLRIIVDNAIELPSPPIVIQHLQELFKKDEVQGHEIARIVEMDQSLTARVLRLVNSPFYGFSRKVISVEEAVTMLGLNTIRQLLLGTSLLSILKVANQSSRINGFWMHSLGVGVIAKAILSHRDREVQSEAFLGGLLHDIGRFILLKSNPARFDEFYVGEDAAVDLKGEAEYFGVDHQKIGEALARKWNFPESICLVIGRHHCPRECRNQNILVASINIADIICHGFDIGKSGNFYVSDFNPELWKALGLRFSDLEKRLYSAIIELEKSKEFFLEIA